MTRQRRGISLLETIVCLTVLMIIGTTVTLSAFQRNTKHARKEIVNVCSTTAIRERRTVTTELDEAFIVCRPDGRIQVDQSERLTVFSGNE